MHTHKHDIVHHIIFAYTHTQMELNGVRMSESDNYVASGDDGKHLKFLEEVMELRGEIHHLENSPTPDIALVKRLWNDNNGKKAPFFYTTNCCVCVCA